MSESASEEKTGLFGSAVDLSERILESNKSANLLIIGFVVLFGIALLGIGILTMQLAMPRDLSKVIVQKAAASEARLLDFSTKYFCARGKSIAAVFSDGQAELSLSDGRTIALPQVFSNSGFRYANPDDSFVFSNTDVGAFIDEDGVSTYNDCVKGS